MEIMLFYSILFLLLSNAVTTTRDKSILYSRITIISLVATSYIVQEILEFLSLSEGIGIFGGLFHETTLSIVFQFFIYSLSALILHLTAFFPRKMYRYLTYWQPINGGDPEKVSAAIERFQKELAEKCKTDNLFNLTNKKAPQYQIIEYPLVLLFIITGASFLTSSSDIVSIFLSIELQSYGLYLVCSLYRDSEWSTSAGLTYFLLGGLSSCFILLGTSLLYLNSGTTSLENFYIIINLGNVLDNTNNLDLYGINYIQLSLLIMAVGFLFKISAAPFHFWSPDVYDAIPTIVTTFVAIIAKISILIFLLELIHYTVISSNGFNWTIILLYSSLLSLIIGTILGLNQSRIKRLFAYSTISHLGFILLALSINSVESIQAFTFYLMQYSLSNLNAFMLLIAIGYCVYADISSLEPKTPFERNNSPVQLVSQLKSFFNVNPLLSVSFAITIYSFVGIPPLVGFFAKQMVLSAALIKGYVFITLVAILTSVISAVYYLGMIKQMMYWASDYVDVKRIDYDFHQFNQVNFVNIGKHNNIHYEEKSVHLSGGLTYIISILTLIILLFILSPQEWLSLTNILALIFFNS